MADDRDLIRSRINIVDLVSQRVSLKRSGKTWTGLCPFHDDRDPSFRVNPDLGVYKCWACGVSGDIFTWVMETEHVEFGEALRILAQQAGVELKRGKKREPSQIEAQDGAMAAALEFFRSQLSKSTAAKEYCEKRQIDLATIDDWELGYAPDVNGALANFLSKEGHSLNLCRELFLVDRDSGGGFYDRFRGRLMFPIRDERGKLVAFGGRIIGDSNPKYINSSDTPLYSKSRVLYGLNRAKTTIAECKSAVLVEGYLDVIACHRSGVKNAVASLGTALAEDHVRLLKRWCEEVIVLYDSDAAGQKAAEKACELIQRGGLRVRVARVPVGKDPDTLFREQGKESVVRMVDRPLTEPEYLVQQLSSRMSDTQEEYWDEVAEILARAKRHQDVVGIIDSLVPKFPFTKDQKVARLSIERMIRVVRSRIRREQGRPGITTQNSRWKSALNGLESAIIKALLIPELASDAWQVCQRKELFLTSIGQEIATAVVTELQDGPPAGAAVQWVPNIENELLKDTLMSFDREVLPKRGLLPVERQIFLGAVERMEASLEERSRTDLKLLAKDDLEARKDLIERLRRAKGGDVPDVQN